MMNFCQGCDARACTPHKRLLPKISAIPAVALPVALLQALGHKSPIDGVVRKQDPIIKVYCLIICGVVTPLFRVAGTYIKMQFPLKEAAQYSALTMEFRSICSTKGG